MKRICRVYQVFGLRKKDVGPLPEHFVVECVRGMQISKPVSRFANLGLLLEARRVIVRVPATRARREREQERKQGAPSFTKR